MSVALCVLQATASRFIASFPNFGMGKSERNIAPVRPCVRLYSTERAYKLWSRSQGAPRGFFIASPPLPRATYASLAQKGVLAGSLPWIPPPHPTTSHIRQSSPQHHSPPAQARSPTT